MEETTNPIPNATQNPEPAVPADQAAHIPSVIEPIAGPDETDTLPQQVSTPMPAETSAPAAEPTAATPEIPDSAPVETGVSETPPQPLYPVSEPQVDQPIVKVEDKPTPAELASSFEQLDIDLIKPNPWQPRKVFKEEKLDELAASIKEHGVLQPLVVIPAGDGTYQLIVGERRLRASKQAGLAKVPVIIRDAMQEQHKLEVALIENIQRHNLDPIEEAMAYQQLIDTYHLTQEEVAKKVGKGRTTVTNMLRLLHLPLKIQRALAEGIITEGHARAILAVVGMERQLMLLDMIIRDNMTVRQVEDKAREIMDRPKQVKAQRTSSDPETAAIENELRGKLGTKVKIQKSGEAGKIMIEFFSKEELDAFLDKVQKLQ